MKKISIVLVAVFVSLLIFSGLSAGEEKENSGKKLFEEKCSVCHSTERATSKKKSKEGWERTVKRMQKKLSGHISDEEAEAIVEYLSTHYGETK